jgi:glycine cleavage system H protein
LEEYTYQADKFVFHVKKSLLYSADDVWVRQESDGAVKVGLTDFAQRRSGDIVFAMAQPKGSEVKRGGLLGNYETVKVVQDILSPVEGVITEINSLIDSKPEVINSDPYGEGWVAVIKLGSSLEGLLTAKKYFKQMKAKVANELKKIKGL